VKLKNFRIHVGLRTLKTTVAVVIAMVIVEALGTTDSKLIFAMLGAMSAVQPTFRESLEACLSQIIGVIFGAVCGVILLALPLHPLLITGIGIVLVITLYNALQIRYSPSLPCFIVVMLCTTPDVNPIIYSLGRIWDTAIGLAVGMFINMLVFPYDNSQKIRATAESLDTRIIEFLEDLFDGDDILPDTKQMMQTIISLERQLNIFSNQKLILNMRKQHNQLEILHECERKAQALISQMEVLCAMGKPGKLTKQNLLRLSSCGADIKEKEQTAPLSPEDHVTNYHVSQILILRQELLEVLRK